MVLKQEWKLSPNHQDGSTQSLLDSVSLNHLFDGIRADVVSYSEDKYDKHWKHHLNKVDKTIVANTASKCKRT
jgi:hypothetical protein